MDLKQLLRSRLVRIKGVVLGNLAVGFVVSILIPRLAIDRLGVASFGIYAVIVGFSGVLAFSDLGLIPGLTRSLAKPVADGQTTLVKTVLRRVSVRIWIVGAVLSLVCLTIFLASVPTAQWSDIRALVAFCLAAVLASQADVHAGLMRVSGRIIEAYLARTCYLLLYVGTVGALYVGLATWVDISVLCYAQLFASTPYFIWIKYRSIPQVADNHSERSCIENPLKATWSEAWHVSSPERFNRVLQLIAGMIERPLILSMTGAALVTSYDLLSRVTLLVSAVPAALSQPLLSMLSHDRARSPLQQKFSGAYAATIAICVLSAVVGLLIAGTLWLFFHVQLFGVPTLLSPAFGLLILSVVAVNVLTAPGVAYCYSEGVIWPITLKLSVELIGVVIGIILAFWRHNGLLFVVSRNVAIGLSAIIFIGLLTKIRKAINGR